MLKAAMWVHGHAFQAEHPADGHLYNVHGRHYSDVIGYDRGFGKRYGIVGRAVDREGDRVDTWFHVAIPTPVIADDRALFLEKLFVLFTLGRDRGLIGIAKVHAWDGNRGPMVLVDNPDGRVSHSEGAWDALQDTGRGPLASNAWYPRTSERRRAHVEYGLGISVLVRAYDTAQNAWVEFHAAGADFHDTQV